MNTEVLYANSKNSFQIQRIQQAEVLVLKFKGNLSHYEYMAGFDKLYHFYKVHEYFKIILDYQELGRVSIASRIWFILHFAPKLYAPNIRAACVTYQNIASQIALQTIREELQERGYPLQLQHFDSMTNALNWFAAQEVLE
ncbi:MAG: hypothetical protein ACPGJS_02320 [Flammeovirgaceae bacterium]